MGVIGGYGCISRGERGLSDIYAAERWISDNHLGPISCITLGCALRNTRYCPSGCIFTSVNIRYITLASPRRYIGYSPRIKNTPDVKISFNGQIKRQNFTGRVQMKFYKYSVLMATVCHNAYMIHKYYQCIFVSLSSQIYIYTLEITAIFYYLSRYIFRESAHMYTRNNTTRMFIVKYCMSPEPFINNIL
jgi:hypothetical protein